MDATGSMGSYISSATKNIETICDNVRTIKKAEHEIIGEILTLCQSLLQIIRSEQLAGPGALRVGLLAYRDHPPQDHTYIVKNCELMLSHYRISSSLCSNSVFKLVLHQK